MGTPTPGPGKFSKRTDKAVSEANRNLPNPGYGEQASYKDQMAGAPLAQDQTVNVQGMNFNDLFGNAANNVVPLDAGTTMPNVPVTDGADAGPGAGSEVLKSADTAMNDYMAAYLPVLQFIADRPGSSDAARNLIRNLKAQM